MLPSVVKNKIEQIWLDVIAGGVSQPTEVIEQLTYLMFAKQIDEREADIEMAELLSGEKQSHIFGESREEQALRWRNFKGMEARALHKHFVDRVFIFLINLNSNENSAFSRYLKHATFKINEPLALQKVVAGLEDLFENDIKDLDMQGDLYEYMLGKLNSAGRLGAFRTPKHIRDMMVKLMMPTPDMKICDPACGTAGFLISSAEYIRSEYGNKMTAEQWEKYGSETFTGFDTDETMCRLSCMNLMLHSVINPQLNKQDSVSKDYQVKDAYDLILANPPFKGTINKENINESLLAITNTTKTELLFVALFIRLLRVGGRCACIVPDGVLFGSSKAHKNLRKELIENQYLEAVISMPSGVFKPYAGVSTAILIFTKTNGTGTDADLDEEEREAYEAEFVEDGGVPEHIPPERINKYIFNVDTVDRMISDLMNNGIRHKNGNHVGKTIIFAQNKLHAKFIVDRFNELYPQYKGNFCKLVVCDEPYAGQNLKDFKKADDYPFITVTVDMLETGIDVPEITNLVFAKKVYSRIKFEQMLGRGTRLCENLFGEGEDKKEFVVFDYMRNFQFFDEHPKGREAGEVVAPVAARFIRMVQMIKCLQDANYVDVKYQNIRENLIDHVVDDVKAMGTERVEVRLELRYVERYKERKQYECLEEIHKEEIIDHLAKLVVSDEKDEAAISFDVLMYGLMLSVMTGGKNLGRLKRYVVGNANILLKECATIPDIKVRISELKELVSDHYWDVQDVLKFEETRKSLREIMKYIPAKKEKLHYSNFKDIVVFREEGRLTSLSASDFEDYRAKVNEYVEAHKTTPAINKLLHNEPISVEDYNELERIFTVELGTAEDYEMNYQDTPFGLLIRKIAKMDRTAAYAAFSTFILEERPNTEQLHFIEQVVDYVVENGYINNVLDLMKTPFDRPYKFSLIFTYEEQVKFVKIINNIKNNALVT